MSDGVGRHRRCPRDGRWRLPKGALAVLAVLGVTAWQSLLAADPPAGPGAAAAPIWIGITDPAWRRVWRFPENDWNALFASPDRWQQARAGVGVFILSKRFIAESNPEDLRRLFAYLHEHGIRLAMQGTPLLAGPACGLGVEGHGTAHDMADLAKRIQENGGSLDYLAFDEPLFYGRFFRRFPKSRQFATCDFPVETLAQQAATKVREVRQIFPKVTVGDVEPVGLPPAMDPEWHAALGEWIEAYHRAAGEAFAFIHLDILWEEPTWTSELPAVDQLVRAHAIPVGVIYNAAASEPHWSVATLAHMEQIEDRLGVRPDIALFWSWDDQPRKLLPDDDPESFASVVRAYGARQRAARSR